MKKGHKTLCVLGAAAALIAVAAVRARGCEWCPMSQALSPLASVAGHGFKVSERLSLLDRVYNGSERVAGAGARETSQTTEVTGFVSPSPRLALLAVIPYRHAATRGDLVVGGDGSMIGLDREGAGSSHGVGDVSLMARYALLAAERPSGGSRLAVVLGVKLPTGGTDARTDNGGRYLDSHLQPGTGSTDWLVGLSLSHARARASLSANVLATLPGEGEFGDTRHRFGNALRYDLTARYRVSPAARSTAGTQWFAVLGVGGEALGKEQHDGVTQPNTGGRTLFVAPGLQVAVGRRWVVDLSYQAAVYRDLGGTQLGETSQAVAAVSYRF